MLDRGRFEIFWGVRLGKFMDMRKIRVMMEEDGRSTVLRALYVCSLPVCLLPLDGGARQSINQSRQLAPMNDVPKRGHSLGLRFLAGH